MEYRETAPHPALRPFVRTYWTLRGRAADLAPQPVLPDGTTEIIVHRGRPFWRMLDDGDGRQGTRLFVGQMRRPAVLHADPDSAMADVVGIRLQPAAARWILGVPQDSLVDEIADVDSLGCRWLTMATRRAEAATSTDLALSVIERALLARVRDVPRPDAGIRAAVGTIDRNCGRVNMERLAANIDLSRRQFERRFHAAVGLSPGVYARIVRLQAAAVRVADESAVALVDVSAETGFYDQSHMAREFLAFAGRSPSEFRRQLSALTSHLLTR